jgi:hypothetical protein
VGRLAGYVDVVQGEVGKAELGKDGHVHAHTTAVLLGNLQHKYI